MKTWQKIALLLVVIGLIVSILLTWNSMASLVFLFGLVMVVPICLMQHFVNSDRKNDFLEDDNG